jgi:hypothetical protein
MSAAKPVSTSLMTPNLSNSIDPGRPSAGLDFEALAVGDTF